MSTATEVEKKHSQACLDCWREIGKLGIDIGSDKAIQFARGWMAAFQFYVLPRNLEKK